MATEKPGRPVPAPSTGRDVQIVTLPPGSQLSAVDEQWVVDGLVESLPDLRMRDLFTLRRDFLADAEYLVIAVDRERDAVVGALSSHWVELPSGRSCLHVMVQFVGQRYRDGVIFRQSWSAHFTRLLADGRRFPELIALKTYNPVVYCAMSAYSAHPQITMYPVIKQRGGPASATSRLAAEAAAEVAAAVSPGHRFEPDLGVIRGIGRPIDLYRKRPVASVPAVDEYFAATTNPGDRVLCLLHVPTTGGQQAILTALGVPFAHSPPDHG